MLKRILSVGLVIAVITVLAACTSGRPQASDDQKEQRKAEFETETKPISKEKSTEGQRAEIQKILKSMILDGKHESPSLVLKLLGVDAFEKVVSSAREISVELTIVDTLEGVMKQLGAEKPDNLPPFVRVLPDGKTIHIPGAAVGVEFESIVGLLLPRYVLTDGLRFKAICQKAERSPDVREDIFKFALRPIAEEAKWQEEVLFQGSVMDLCANKDLYPKYYPNNGPNGVVVLKRPEIKFFPVPKDKVEVGSVKDLNVGGWLVFPTMRESGLTASYGMLGSIRTEGMNIVTLEFSGVPTISPNPGDEGAPVYYISGDEEAPLKLVGFILDASSVPAVAISSEQYLMGIEEISYMKK